MTRSEPHARQRGDVQFVAGLVAYVVFALSAGLYAGTEGRVRVAALALGIGAELACVPALVAIVRPGAGRPQGPGRWWARSAPRRTADERTRP